MKSNFILVAAGLLLSSVPATAATIVYNNLTASSGATSGGSAGISGTYPLGDSFSTGAGTSFLSDLMLDLSANTPSDGKSVTVTLLSNAANSPGTLLATLGTIADSSLSSSLTAVDLPGLSTSLAANTRYWIELSTTGSAQWSFDNTNVGVGVANEYNYFTGTSYANSAFTPYQMEVTTTSTTAVTPEPSTLSLLALGCAGGMTFLRRRLAKV